MESKYLNKYRISSHRKLGWDYSSEAMYFITIVTQNRECNLGDILENKVTLSEWGRIVQEEWLNSFEIRDELFLDEYIIMPNHIHAIIVLINPVRISKSVNDHINFPCIPSFHSRKSDNQEFLRKPKSISSFVAGFKSAVNTKIDDDIDAKGLNIPKYNKHNHFFQPNYHDHIIRNDAEYQRIKRYIIENPKKWPQDNFSNRSKM
jgi:putative transposase